MSNRPELNDEDSRFSSADASGFEIQDIAPVEVTENTYEEPVEVDEEDIAGSVKTKHPMPVGIKIAMGIAATLFVLVIASVFLSSDNAGSDEKNSADVSSDAHITPDELMGVNSDNQKPDEIAGMLGLPDTSSGIPPPNTSTSNGDAATQSAFIDTQAATHNAATVEPLLSGQVTEIKVVPEMDIIKSMLDEHAAGLSKLTASVNHIESEEIPDVNNQIATVKDSMRITQDLVNKHELYVADALKAKAQLPPFELLSIDIWGNVASAVILLDNKTSFASIGDTRAGWQIVNIMKPDCISVQRVNQTNIKICRKVNI